MVRCQLHNHAYAGELLLVWVVHVMDLNKEYFLFGYIKFPCFKMRVKLSSANNNGL